MVILDHLSSEENRAIHYRKTEAKQEPKSLLATKINCTLLHTYSRHPEIIKILVNNNPNSPLFSAMMLLEL